MTKLTSTKCYPSYSDDDSRIQYDYTNSSTRTFVETPPKRSSFLLSGLIGRKRPSPIPLIKFPSDGIIQRIRPTMMKNSENSDFIICQTDRGTYVAHQTPMVPQWVRELVRQIELQQN